MSDDLDDLLRRAMQTMVEQAPPGYFEDFAKRTLTRLEDGSSMQTDDHPPARGPEPAIAGSAGSTPAGASETAEAAASSSSVPADKPSAARDRDDDSGLHDIRGLAASQRMRLSKKTSQPALSRDDELIAASGSWRAVALPEPAKMISLPELAELPTAQEVKEAEKAARRAEKEQAREARRQKTPTGGAAAGAAAASAASIPAAGPAAASVAAPAAAVEPPARSAAAASVTPIAAARAKRPPNPGARRNAMIAVAALGVAAAAGAVVVVSTQGGDQAAESSAAAKTERARSTPLPELDRRFNEPRPTVTAIDDSAGAGPAAAPTPAPPPPPTVAVEKPKAPEPPPTKGIGKVVPNVVDDQKPADKKPDPNAPKRPGKDGSDPDFDKLLKEAGYQEKQTEKPKLEKKSLSGDDIKKGMNSVAGKVSACYSGQQGTAAVKLTVTPDGAIQKIAVTGQFAGTPVATCVEAAVRGAAFPAWDGGPQSVNYSYLLSE